MPATGPPVAFAGGTWAGESDWPALRAAQLADRFGELEGWTQSSVRAHVLDVGPGWEGPARSDVTVELD